MNRFRRFQFRNDEIVQLLISDDSGDERYIAFDEEDQAFLEGIRG